MSYKYFDCMTGDMVSIGMNTPLEPDDPRLAGANRLPRADIDRPRPVTVTGDNIIGYSELLDTTSRESAPRTYEAEVAALRRKYGIGEDGEPDDLAFGRQQPEPDDGRQQPEHDDGRYKSLMICPTLTARERSGDFRQKIEG